MIGRVISLVAAASMAGAPQSAPSDKGRPRHEYGPMPSWDAYRRIAEAAVTARLLDPESARFRWITGIAKGELKPFLSARVAGYWACGAVNARNTLGGYTGFETFLIAIDDGRVLSLDKDGRPGGMFTDACNKLIREGSLPAVPAETASIVAPPGAETPSRTTTASADADASPTINAAGFRVRAMPEGGYISAVTAGSLAASAGLKPGMVVASVNAIPLAGMGEAMVKVIDAAGTHAALTLVGGTTIKLGDRK